VMSLVIFENFNVTTWLTAASLAVLLPLWMTHPRIARLEWPLVWRAAMGLGAWVFVVGGVWWLNTDWRNENLLDLQTEATNQLAIAETLLALNQRLQGNQGTSPPSIILSERVLPSGRGRGEASVVVRNDGDVPVIVGGNLTIVAASTPLSISDVPLSIRWKGSTASKRILSPMETAHIDVVASGVPTGWKIPGVGEVGNRFCLNLLTTDAAFGQGFIDLLCQTDWTFVGLSDEAWFDVRLTVTASSLFDLDSPPQIVEKTYKVAIGDNEFNLLFEALDGS